MLVLNGWNDKGEQQQFFTLNERATALHVAQRWDAKGWEPVLFSKTYDGKFKFLYNWRTSQRRRSAA